MRYLVFFNALIGTLLGSVATAETPMPAAEFETFTTGKTFSFGQGGQQYGAEEYREGRHVIWSFVDGQEVEECQHGFWYEEGQNICFLYETGDGPQCWQFYKDKTGLSAVFMNTPDRTSVYVANQSDKPLLCLGPNIGV